MIELARNEELEALVAANPGDGHAYLVYSDWLQTQGDPLGEVIALSLAAEFEEPRERKLKINAKKALKRYVEERIAPSYPALRDPLLDGDMDFIRGLIHGIKVSGWSARMHEALAQFLDDPVTSFVATLHLYGSPITDLTPCLGRPLRQLVLRKAENVSDLQPLAGHPTLEQLDLTATQVTDLSPLRTCPKLWKLYLRATPVTDLSPLADIKTLEFVSVEDTRVTDIGALQELPGLCEVWLYRSSVSEDAGLELGKAVEANGARPRPGITKIVYGP